MFSRIASFEYLAASNLTKPFPTLTLSKIARLLVLFGELTCLALPI